MIISFKDLKSAMGEFFKDFKEKIEKAKKMKQGEKSF